MTALGNTGLRQLALKVMAQHEATGASAEALAATARRAYDDLARVAAPLIGQVGVDALTGRAVHLVRREYPWLAGTPKPEQEKESFAHLLVCLEQQDPAVATEAARAVLTTFTGLLVTFIGEPLTVSILRQAWPEAFADASIEET